MYQKITVRMVDAFCLVSALADRWGEFCGRLLFGQWRRWRFDPFGPRSASKTGHWYEYEA